MSWVRRAETGARHACEPPMRDRTTYLPSPVGGLGDLWRCPCGRLWRVGRRCGICERHGYHELGQCVVGLAWRPATLGQRLRHRRRR